MEVLIGIYRKEQKNCFDKGNFYLRCVSSNCMRVCLKNNLCVGDILDDLVHSHTNVIALEVVGLFNTSEIDIKILKLVFFLIHQFRLDYVVSTSC